MDAQLRPFGVTHVAPLVSLYEEMTSELAGIDAHTRRAAYRRMLYSRMRAATACVSAGQFEVAIRRFRQSMYIVVVAQAVVPAFAAEDAHGAIPCCATYCNGLLMELYRKDLAHDPAAATDPAAIARQIQLKVMFVRGVSHPDHKMLALRSAMTTCYDVRNFRMAALLAEQVLALHPEHLQVQRNAQKIARGGAAAADAIPVQWDLDSTDAVCGASYTLIPPGAAAARCRVCNTAYHVEYAGTLCRVCALADVIADNE